VNVYQINPRRKSSDYMTVFWDEKDPDMIQMRFPKKKVTLRFDARAGADLIDAVNEICRDSGHAYFPNLGKESRDD